MIHPCDKPCGNKTASGYCVTTACINPQFSNIVTNADRLRAMGDEELAYMLACEHWCLTTPQEKCEKYDMDCEKCCLGWLREEAKE